MSKKRKLRKTVYPTYEKLFGEQAESLQSELPGVQTMQKLFFSIRMTSYFRYLERYDSQAGNICNELMKYSGCKDPDDFAVGSVDDTVTLYDMLKIAGMALTRDELRHIGYFITDMLLIRPFALYAETNGSFGYPSCCVPPDAPPCKYILEPEEEVPF